LRYDTFYFPFRRNFSVNNTPPHLFGGEGTKVASLGKVIITASANHTAYGSMTVATKIEREEYTVTINAPTAFLTSATTVYPVTVDPTLTIDEEYTPDGEYYPAIEDLCVYDGTEDPNYDNIATIGAYETGATSAMLYRITVDAWDYLAVDDYLESGRFHSATLHVPVMNLTTGLTVATTPSLGSWTSGTSQSVDSMYFEDYYPDANSDTTALSSSANSAGAEIDVTKVFEYLATHPSAVNLGFMMYATPSTTITNPQSSFGVYQVEEADTGVHFEVDYDIFSGSYYINSKNTGKFLDCPNAATVAQDVYDQYSTQAWQVAYLGSEDEYFIHPNLQSTRVLVMDDSGDVFVGTKGNYDVENYTWRLNFYADTATIYNVGTGRYLYADASNNIGSTFSTSARWRFCKTDAFVPLTEITFGDIVMEVGETVTPTIVSKTPSNATWANVSDFSWSSSNTSVATITSSGTINTLAKGQITITATHKSTGTVQNFDLLVGKKAIIILPGIMGSQLYLEEDIILNHNATQYTFDAGTCLWVPLGTFAAKVKALSCNSSGISNVNISTVEPIINQYNISATEYLYGAQDMYRQLYNKMYAHFYSLGYDVIFYEYDWRKDPYDTALMLNDFINNNYYIDVVFVSHSMGGIVSSYYLSLGEAQRNKVDKHISIGTPYLGAAKMVDVFVTGNAFDVIKNLAIGAEIVSILPNMPSIYGLLPYEKYFSPYLSYDNSILESPQICSTYNSTITTLSGCVENWNNALHESVTENQSRLFINNSHITTYVDSYYIVGNGIKTIENVEYNHFDDGINFITTENETTNAGDGTVSLVSSTINDTIPYNKLFIKSSSDEYISGHTALINGDKDDYATLDLIVEITEGDINQYTTADLSDVFGVTRQ